VVFALLLAADVPVQHPTNRSLRPGLGRQVLEGQTEGDGSWEFSGHDVGITALCTIALIENGVPLNESSVQRGYEYVKKNCNKLKNTYDLSLVIVLFSRLAIVGQAADQIVRRPPDCRSDGQRRLAIQCPGPGIDAEKILRDPTAGPKPKRELWR
jgi:hypothetical protein